MSERAERIHVDLAVPVHRDAQDALLFLTLSGLGTQIAARQAEYSARFLAVT
jgi:hypothetical protein